MTELTFLGTGTSQGVPMIACGCHVCTSLDPKDKRLRSSVLIDHDGVRILIDAGPDFRQQMLRESVDRLDAILFTHDHKDHTGGLDDVRAYNYFQRGPMDVYAEPYVLDSLRSEYDYAFAENPYPGVPDLRLHPIGEEPFRVKNATVVPIRGFHYRLPVLGFRIGGIAYLTDMNRIEKGEIGKFRGVEVLVINALRKEKHLSHFTLDEALEVIRKVGPKRSYLTHLSHQMGRYREIAPELEGRPVWFSYDGLKIRTDD